MVDKSTCHNDINQVMIKELNDRRLEEFKMFDETKAGVKGLVDSGIAKVPLMFQYGRETLASTDEDRLRNTTSQLSTPVIDLQGISDKVNPILRRSEVIGRVRSACEKYGFFQVANHGIPIEIMDEMIEGVRRFHEQGVEAKKAFYSRDRKKVVTFMSNHDLYGSPSSDWRDTLQCFVAPDFPQPDEVRSVCREILKEYSKRVMELGITLFELLSEALGLDRNHLKDMYCAEGLLVLGHYYPKCPEPELTLGVSKHTDGSFITMLLQDQLGLQVSHGDDWIDIPPVHGAIVVNIGDLLQLITNDKFISVNHRVLTSKFGPRTSVASFFRPYIQEGNISKVYGPIQELLSDKNPPIYQQTDVRDYVIYYLSRRLSGVSALQPFKLQK